MKNKNIKIMLIIIGIFILIISIFYRNDYIVKNNKQVIKEMDESTQVSSLNSTINELNKAHEEYQAYIQTNKTNLANAISNEGITTSSEDTFETMITNVSKILSNKTNDATATADQILTGQTAYVKGNKVTGTMANKGAVTASIDAGGSYTIPEGYHNGSGKVTANGVTTVEKTVNSATSRNQTIDFSDVPNYQNLTVDNFAMRTCGSGGLGGYNSQIIITYNNTTGIVTVDSSSSAVSLAGTLTVVCFY